MERIVAFFTKFILIFCCFIGLTNCSESSSELEPPAFSLVGIWTVTNVMATGCTNSDLNGNNSNYGCPPTIDGVMVCTQYTFGSATVDIALSMYHEGSLVIGDPTGGTYSLHGTTLSMSTYSLVGGTSSSKATVSRTGDILTMYLSKNSSSGCVVTYTLVKS